MSIQQPFKAIAENEIPPDVDWTLVAQRPGLKALLDKTPEPAKAAVFYLYRRGEETAKAKAFLSTEDLRALAAQGDDVASAILAVREEELASQVDQGGAPISKNTIRALRLAGMSEQAIAGLSEPGHHITAKFSEARKDFLRRVGLTEEEIAQMEKDEEKIPMPEPVKPPIVFPPAK
jgi:hypothetical protein